VPDDEQPHHQHRWLHWVGLDEKDPPPDPDSWVPVASNLSVDDPDTGRSALAAQIVGKLGRAGIDAHQRAYVPPDTAFLFAGTAPADRVRVAVVVHERNEEQAKRVVTTVAANPADLPPLSDQELTRQALEAGEELKREGHGDEIDS
jgi:hypothetical protein